MATRNSFQQQRSALLSNDLLDPSLARSITSGIASLTSNAQDAAKRLSAVQEPRQVPNIAQAIANLSPEQQNIFNNLSPEQQENYLSSNAATALSRFGQGGSNTPNSSGSTASIPSGERAAYIREGLINRGLQPHVADAFLVNFKDESGLDSNINEHNPIVPGSRGGFGLYQLTGPRRNAYESFAAQRGVHPGNIDAQLDFMISELQGPEARAAQRIFSAPTTALAAQAIVSSFLRPAAEHRNSRMSRYAKL